MFAESSASAANDGGEGDGEGDKTSEVFVRFNSLLHGGAFEEVAGEGGSDARASAQRDAMRELLSVEFVQKYIACVHAFLALAPDLPLSHRCFPSAPTETSLLLLFVAPTSPLRHGRAHRYAKRQTPPQLTAAASELLSEAYGELRSKQDTRTSCVTPRVLESLIRLASAHAKGRLSSTVDEEDCAAAVDIMRFALYHDADPLGTLGNGGGDGGGDGGGGGAGKRARNAAMEVAGADGGGDAAGDDAPKRQRTQRSGASTASSAAAADDATIDTETSSYLDGTQELDLDESQDGAAADETKNAELASSGASASASVAPITVDASSEAFQVFKSTLARMCVITARLRPPTAARARPHRDHSISPHRLARASPPSLPLRAPIRYDAMALGEDYVTLDSVIAALAQSTTAQYTRPLVLAMLEEMEANGDVMFDAEESRVYQV